MDEVPKRPLERAQAARSIVGHVVLVDLGFDALELDLDQVGEVGQVVESVAKLTFLSSCCWTGRCDGHGRGGGSLSPGDRRGAASRANVSNTRRHDDEGRGTATLQTLKKLARVSQTATQDAKPVDGDHRRTLVGSRLDAHRAA